MPKLAVGRPDLFISTGCCQVRVTARATRLFPTPSGQPSRAALGSCCPSCRPPKCERGHFFADPLALPSGSGRGSGSPRCGKRSVPTKAAPVYYFPENAFCQGRLDGCGRARCPPAGGSSGQASTRTPSAPALGKDCTSSRWITQRLRPRNFNGSRMWRSRCLGRSPSLQSISSGRFWRKACRPQTDPLPIHLLTSSRHHPAVP